MYTVHVCYKVHFKLFQFVIKVCLETECGGLCYHMYSCDLMCFTYNNGHICKHIHRVHSLVQEETRFHSADPSGLNETQALVDPELQTDKFNTISEAQTIIPFSDG